MMTITKYFVTFLLLLTTAVIANAITFPLAKISPQDKNILLLNQGTQIYLIHNVSQQSIWIDHPIKNRSASAGWASFIRPGRWSALNLDKKDFVMSCSQIKPGEIVYLNCEKTISIYVYPIPTKKSGTYWLIEDKPYNELLKILPTNTKPNPRN
jgi:hypothetical protein